MHRWHASQPSGYLHLAVEIPLPLLSVIFVMSKVQPVPLRGKVELFTDRLKIVQSRICQAAEAAGRDAQSITLLAVSKARPVEALEMALQAGLHAFGESYLQEALPKIEQIGSRAQWHFIGPLQANKTRAIAEHFDWVHSVDRLKVARRLSEQRPAGLPPLNVCLQVNTSAEASKAGVSPAEAPELARQLAVLPGLRLRGLMTLPARSEALARQRQPFRQLHALYQQLKDSGLALDTLSMGMSNDLEAAILEGSTLVRIGSALFGPRQG